MEKKNLMVIGCMTVSRHLLLKIFGLGVSHSLIYCPFINSSSYKGLHYILIASANCPYFYIKNPFINAFQQLHQLSFIANSISLLLY
jgi:hypothetical protein